MMRTAVVIPVAAKRPETVFTDGFVELLFFVFILRKLIYLSPSFTGVGFGTGFPIFTAFADRLPVGCQRIAEPILSPLLDKLITHGGGN